ncbi:MAG: lytic transglycosylase domain-containing protein [Candidatus Sulfopaludibacter sp.]|nr:lytic transglycosylase domain-containing protein [Candidatus Sulfopaludibacter sp.]
MAASSWAASPDVAPARMTSVVRSDSRTGRLVRSVVVSNRAVNQSAEQATPIPSGLNELVESIAARHDLSPQLIHAVIKTESNYNPHAISPKGALGLMQLMPSTARRFSVSHVFDPVENIEGGARYLKYLLELYDGDCPLALAAYNAGEAAVAKYNGIPPFPETQNYVVQVKNNLEKLAAAAQALQAPPSAVQPPPPPSGPTHVQEVVDADGTVRYVSR